MGRDDLNHMRFYDIISKKKNGGALSETEIEYAVASFTRGETPDYQMAALLMAICLKGMDAAETACLTLAMARSGETADLSAIPGVKVDKHSTGGVGDKTTLVITPIVACLGAAVAKMAGRGLGNTGGTVDKLESIPGLRTAFTREEFIGIVRKTGAAIVGQSGELAPADKKMYALRDVTATVDSIPLIAASIMSKKIAAGSDRILLDVKTGSGAFMKTPGDAERLAGTMVDIGALAGRRTIALITDMDIPLGHAVGNALEVVEAVETLKGRGPKDLTDVCIELAANMLFLAEKGGLDACRQAARGAIASGAALDKFAEMVAAQGGDSRYVYDTSLFPAARRSRVVTARESGFITRMNAEFCGAASVMLGAGRETENAPVDHAAGVTLKAKTGDCVQKGDIIAVLHTSDESRLNAAEEKLLSGFEYGPERPEAKPLVYARVE